MGNKTEQLTDDQLIAQFMGKSLTFIHDNLGTVTEKKMSYSGYYEEWNNLMPVVVKISEHIYESWVESNGYKDVEHHERAYLRTFGMMDSNGKYMVRINRMPLECENTLIEATYKAVVYWIQNQNKS